MASNDKTSKLRSEAEARLKDKQTKYQAHNEIEDPSNLLHELQVRQIELEIQSEEFRQTQIALEESRDRYADLYEFAPVGYLTLTSTGQISEINLSGAALLGRERSKLLQQRFDQFVIQEDRDRWHLKFAGAIGKVEKLGIELLLQLGEGSTLYTHLDCLRTEAADGTPEMRMALTDISAMQLNEQLNAAQDELRKQLTILKEKDAALQDSEDRLRMSAETARDAIIMMEAESDTIIEWNLAAELLFGYSQAEILGQVLHEVLMPPRLRETARQALSHFSGSGKGAIVGKTRELTALHKDGTEFPIELSVSAMQRQGKWYATGIARDITERKRYQAQLERQSNYDELTGLPNRNLLTDRLNYVVARCQREQKKLAVLLLNLIRFREINDSLGRAAGDSIMREVAARLRLLVRGMDILARSTGDEFVLAGEVESEEEASHLARRIMASLGQPFRLEGREIFLNGSIGISVLPKDGENSEMLLNNAQVAMYRAKATGGNHFLFYSAEMNAHTLAHFNLEVELRRAIERDELRLYFQPQVSLRSGEISGMEALVRWQHPVRGLVSPSEFIPLAEASGLIVPLGEWVLRSACTQNKAWQKAGLRAVAVAVNLSAKQFDAQDMVALTAQVLSETGLDPAYLELELTESAAMGKADSFVEITKALKGLSVTLSIDDFGTGFSSLSYLKNFTLDRLKIDQSFVRDIVQDPGSAAIVIAVITLAHGLGLSVIAEGVETEAQLNFMRVRGCDEMQGYYFSKPVPAAEFGQLLRDGRKLALPATDDLLGRTLLLVDDEPSILAAMKRILRRDGYQILTASSASEGLELLATHEVAVVMSDQRMPEMTGSEFLAKVRVMYPDTIRIILSGYTDLKTLTEVVNRGEIYKYVEKPWEEATLKQALREAFRHYETRRANRNETS